MNSSANFPSELSTNANSDIPSLISEMKKHEEEKTHTSGYSLVKEFFSSSYAQNDICKNALVLLEENDWSTGTISQIMTPDMLKIFDKWMLEKGFVAYAWTGYDSTTTNDFFHGHFLKWYAHQTENKSIFTYTDYSGCRIQFLKDKDGNLIKELLSSKMGSRRIGSDVVKHDSDNDILAGRKIIILKTSVTDTGGCQVDVHYIYFSFFNQEQRKYIVKHMKLPKNICQYFTPEMFEKCKQSGTIAAGKDEIADEVVAMLDEFIRKNGGTSFFACWAALYSSRLLQVYGGYIPLDKNYQNVADGAAMNRIYISKYLLSPKNHLYLPKLDMENTGIGNHIALALRQHAADSESSKIFALTAPERLLDETDPGEETILFGAELAGNVVSIPCCRKISNYACRLAIFGDTAKSEYSLEDETYIKSFPEIQEGSLERRNDGALWHLKTAGNTEISFHYDGKFEFTIELIEHFFSLPMDLSMEQLVLSDDFKNNMLDYAVKYKNGVSGAICNRIFQESNVSNYFSLKNQGFFNIKKDDNADNLVKKTTQVIGSLGNQFC